MPEDSEDQAGESAAAQPTWKRYFWRNTATNYLRMVLRIVSGVILFRLTFKYLNAEEFGFYTLLWSLFGYSVLLDFGMGFTAQKATAEKTATGEIGELNRLIATVFWTFFGIAIALLLLFLLFEPMFLEIVKVAPENRGSFSLTYRAFFIGLTVVFPIAIFIQILTGLQRIDIANGLNIAAGLLGLGLVPWALIHEWPFMWVMICALICAAIPPLGAVIISFRLIPGFSIHPRHFDRKAIRNVLSFSLVIYLITFTNVIMVRTDQAVVSAALGIGILGLYQAGYKAAEMFAMVSAQLLDFLAPAAAQLSVTGDRSGVRELLGKSTSLVILLATPLCALTAVYLEPLIALLTDFDRVPKATLWVGWTLLAASWWLAVTASCSNRILMMSGWERPLLKLAIFEAVLNLGISLTAAFYVGHQAGKFDDPELARTYMIDHGLVWVAIGTLVPTLIGGVIRTWKLTAPFAEISVPSLVVSFIRPVWLPVVASLAVLGLVAWLFPYLYDSERGVPLTLVDLGWRGLLVLGVAGAIAMPQIRKITRMS